MNTYVEKDGVRREVKNLGWLLRNWKDVDGFAVLAGNQVANGALLVAKLKSGGNYVSTFASFSVLLDFLDRPVFRGLRCVVSYARPDGGPKKVGAFDVGDKKASAWIYNKVGSVQRGGNVVLNGLRGLLSAVSPKDRLLGEVMRIGGAPTTYKGYELEVPTKAGLLLLRVTPTSVHGLFENPGLAQVHAAGLRANPNTGKWNTYGTGPSDALTLGDIGGFLKILRPLIIRRRGPGLSGCACPGGLKGIRRDDGGREFSGVYINDEVSIVTPRPTGYGDNDGDGPYIPGLPEALQRLGARAAIMDGLKGQVLRTAGGPLFIYATRTGIYGQFIDPQRAYERFWNDFDYKGRVKYRMDVGRVEIVGLGGSHEIKARDVNEFMLWACEAARQR